MNQVGEYNIIRLSLLSRAVVAKIMISNDRCATKRAGGVIKKSAT